MVLMECQPDAGKARHGVLEIGQRACGLVVGVTVDSCIEQPDIESAFRSPRHLGCTVTEIEEPIDAKSAGVRSRNRLSTSPHRVQYAYNSEKEDT